MNCKRGFFRLWMVFAGVCLIGALLGNVPDIVRPPVNRSFYYDIENDALLDSADSFKFEAEKKALAGETVNVAGKLSLGRYTAKLPGDISITFVTSSEFTGEDANKVRYGMWPAKEAGGGKELSDEMGPRLEYLLGRAEEIVRTHVAESRIQSLGILALVGAGIPLAFLAFGATIAWIFRGFRSKGGAVS